MRCFMFIVAYDGRGFSGWQRQGPPLPLEGGEGWGEGVRTVQGALEQALARIEGRAVVVTGAGRTDAGVHAAGQVASVRLTKPIDAHDLHRALNAVLPDDLRVRAVEERPATFNARIHARGKAYHYWIWNARIMPPLLRELAWHVPQSLDVAVMSDAARQFEGTHDFVGLQAQGARVKTTTRTVTASRIARVPIAHWPGSLPDVATPSPLFCYETSGTGFLRHMVRTMVGTVVDVGRGRRTLKDVEALLAFGMRARAGRTAPPHGLTLWAVDYEAQ